MAAKQKYDERFVKIAKVLCMRGGTDEDLADAFEVSPRTINRCQNILSSSECDMCEDFDMFARAKEEMK